MHRIASHKGDALRPSPVTEVLHDVADFLLDIHSEFDYIMLTQMSQISANESPEIQLRSILLSNFLLAGGSKPPEPSQHY